jgi:hypothetical protein
MAGARPCSGGVAVVAGGWLLEGEEGERGGGEKRRITGKGVGARL